MITFTSSIINGTARTLLAAVLLVMAPLSQAAEHPAQELIKGSITEMLSVLKNEKDRISTDSAYLESKVDEIIVPNIDFDTMTKLAVGKFWRKATPAQRTELVTEFKSLLLNTYTGALTQYSGETITFEPFRPEARKPKQRAVVRSTFSQSSGAADVPVNYKLHKQKGKNWLIYNIEVNDISLVTSYRTAFANEIGKGGIDGLLATLKKRNAKS